MTYENIFVGRQAILDQNGKCFAYELLYRDSVELNSASFKSDQCATSRVVANLVHNIGIKSIVGDKIGFVNINEDVLDSDIFLNLPKDRFIFEILEHTKITPKAIEKIKELHDSGYRFAIDDFVCNKSNIDYFEPLFKYIDIIKIDLLLSQKDNIECTIRELRTYDIKLLAEKVEDYETYNACKEMGFELFQGYFFEKPIIISGQKIEPSTLHAIDLINTIQATDNINIITEKFSLYPELTFNLLRYINSAEFSFRGEILHIRHMINLLGPKRLRSWLGLFLYSTNNQNQFQDVIISSAKFKASMMRGLVIYLDKRELAEEAFFVGSLSLVDAYLHIDMHSLLDKISISQAIKDALLYREGYHGKLLVIVEKLQKSNDRIRLIKKVAQRLSIESEQIVTIYNQALKDSV